MSPPTPTVEQVGPTKRWFRLRYHPAQHKLSHPDGPRFRIVPAGRRSGKTEIAKRYGIRFILRRAAEVTWDDPRIGFGAPTYGQARKIYWNDIKKMIPPGLIRGKPRESEMMIELITGAQIYVLGLDVAERIEGVPWDGLFMDEFANIREGAWSENIRPALMDRRGIGWLYGVPEGTGEYQRLYERALSGGDPDWGAYHWRSEDILPPEEIAAAKADLDEHTYEQELGGQFVARSGRVYYKFDRHIHASQQVRRFYDPQKLLMVCFDWNVSPGVACIAQELRLPNGETGTAVIGEVYIQRDSNSERVARAIANQWGSHKGMVHLDGDSTGGARSTVGLFGTDWDIVRAVLRPVFGDRLAMVYQTNPTEKSRVNAVNSRLMSVSGVVRMMIDPQHCPMLIGDFENTLRKDDGSGAIDKRGQWSHMCLAPGTRVPTCYGIVPIESAPEAGFIRGFDDRLIAYEAAGRTGIDRKIVSVCINGEQPILCTPDHPFLTTEGWVCAADLTPSSILLTAWCGFSELRASSSRVCTFGGTMPIDTLLPAIESLVKSTSTAAYGKPSMALSPTVSMSIIATRTRATTGHGTWSSRQEEITSAITRGVIQSAFCDPSTMACQRPERPQRTGIAPPRAGLGIENMREDQRRGVTSGRAAGVGAASRRQWPAPPTVHEIARSVLATMPEPMMRIALARYVAACFGATATARTDHAAEPAGRFLRVTDVRPAGRSDVFCLRVPDDGCFALANGVIVSNSDALGYYVARRFPVGGAQVSTGVAPIAVSGFG